MKPNPVAVAMWALVLAACSAQQPASPAQAATMPEPAVAPPASPVEPAPLPAESTLAKRAPGDTTPPMTIFRAFGNEPFWNINVEEGTLTLTTPDDQSGMVMQGTRRTLPAGVEITGSHDGKRFALTVTEGECSDGMSDNQYQLVSSFRHGELDYTGCGEAAK